MDLETRVRELMMQDLNERNLLSMEIEEKGNSHDYQKRLSRLRGRIEAYGAVLNEIKYGNFE